MNLSKRKLKVYVTLIAVGMAILVLERLSGPAEAPAAEVAESARPARPRAEAGVSKEARAPVVAGPLFPSVADTQDEGGFTRDPFAITDFALEQLSPPVIASAETTGGQAEVAKQSDTEAFESTHRLEAILSSGQLLAVVVNGRVVRLDEVIDDCRFAKTERRSAWFECSDGTAELRMELSFGGSP